MRINRQCPRALAGVLRPLAGLSAPKLALALAASVAGLGCGDAEEEHSLPVVQVGMTKEVPPIYDDGELTIYEVKRGVAFPILAPSEQERSALGELGNVEPYGSHPWVTTDDVRVQVTWTLTNLDAEEHIVELLVDPWNEFGRYYPGLQLTNADDQEYMPNFSGIDRRYIVLGAAEGDGSRVHGTYTFADLEEVAIDLSTVMSIIKNPPVGEDEADEEDLRVTYANHAFHWQNRSYQDLLIARWVPETVAGLTGLDLGLRTYEPATVAVEVAVELVDSHGKRVRQQDDDAPLLGPSGQVISVGAAP